jgi:hypothetical protein
MVQVQRRFLISRAYYINWSLAEKKSQFLEGCEGVVNSVANRNQGPAGGHAGRGVYVWL